MDTLTALLVGAVGGFLVALLVVTPAGIEVTRATGERLAREIRA